MAEIYDGETYEPRKGVGHLLHRVRTEMLAAVDRELAADEQLSALEVTSAQFIIIATLSMGGVKSAADLCKGISYDAGAMTRMIDRLEEKGLLSRSRDPGDRRLVNLELTEKGIAALPAHARLLDARPEPVSAGIHQGGGAPAGRISDPHAGERTPWGLSRHCQVCQSDLAMTWQASNEHSAAFAAVERQRTDDWNDRAVARDVHERARHVPSPTCRFQRFRVTWVSQPRSRHLGDTSFGVANAISLPLTGWLTRTFGQVRLFMWSVALFTVASFLCALAPSLNMLILFRVVQGAVAGPMMPLSQALLLSSYPKAKAGAALGMWSITTLVAPVVGPVLGGWITDNISWPWIFYINIPVGIVAGLATWFIYKKRETPTMKLPIDKVGVFLLVLWVGALQVMLDKGKDLDWFNSGQIVTLAVVAVVGFTIFLVWELTRSAPGGGSCIVRAAAISWSVPWPCCSRTACSSEMWCCCRSGCSNTWVTPRRWPDLVPGAGGLFAIFLTPVVARFTDRVDPRIFVTVAFGIFALVLFMRQHFNTDATIGTLLIPTLVQGIAMSFFFIPLIAMGLSGLSPERIPGASGLFNFARITAGSFGTSITTTLWDRARDVASRSAGRAHNRFRSGLLAGAGDTAGGRARATTAICSAE